MHLDSALQLVHRAYLAVLHAVFFAVRVNEIRFVAGGDDHGRAITGPNIGKRHQDIDLSALKAAVMVAELVPLGAGIAAGMQSDGLTRSAKVGEVLIDEERAV